MNEWRGWLISVDSKHPGDGQPVSQLYAARIANPEEAMTAVKEYANVSNEHMRVLVEISVSHLRALKVPDGKVGRIESVSKH